MPKARRAKRGEPAKKRRKAPSNLNDALSDASAKRRPHSKDGVRVFFRPEHILGHIKRKIMSAHYVVGCVAWCSNPHLLDALRRSKGVSLVINYDRTLIRKHREQYTALTPMPGAKTALYYVRGGGRALMHHKFMVYLDEDRCPISVTTGSWNWTNQSMKNLEHIVSIDDPETAARFMQEHLDVLRVAKPLTKLVKRKKSK